MIPIGIRITQEFLLAQKKEGNEGAPLNFVGDPNERCTPVVHSDIYYAFLSIYRLARALGPKGRVLDSGCGAGYGTDYLADNLPYEITGYDISSEAIEHCRQIYKRANLCFDCVQEFPLPFADKAFDMVFSSNVIEHVADYETYLSEARRVLKPDGLFVMATPVVLVSGKSDHPYHCTNFTPEEWSGVLKDYFQHTQAMTHKLTKQPLELVPVDQTPLVRTIMDSSYFMSFAHPVRKLIIEKCIHNPFNITESNFVFSHCDLKTSELIDSMGLTTVSCGSSGRLAQAIEKATSYLADPVPLEHKNLRRVWYEIKKTFMAKYASSYAPDQLADSYVTPGADLANGFVAKQDIAGDLLGAKGLGARIALGGKIESSTLKMRILKTRWPGRDHLIAAQSRDLRDGMAGQYMMFDLPATDKYVGQKLSLEISCSQCQRGGKILVWDKYDVMSPDYDPGVNAPPKELDLRLDT